MGNEYSRRYYAEHRKELLQQQHDKLAELKGKPLEYINRRLAINAKARQRYATDEKYRENRKKASLRFFYKKNGNKFNDEEYIPKTIRRFSKKENEICLKYFYPRVYRYAQKIQEELL